MADKATVELNDDNFDAEVLKSDVPVLVDFWAPWCGPCRMLAPAIEELATQLTGKVKVGKLNTDEHMNSAAKYGIQSLPTVLIFKGGQVVDKLVGLRQKRDFEQALARVMGPG
ncbi:MAG TPA: thioredoxin [Tepidisphaeraceae bacterium]|nr:thioredoxin [Tepidisphaeraceae bacterium]